MNKYKIVQIVCWLIVFVVLIGMVIWFAVSNRFGFRGFHSTGFNIQNLSGPYNEAGRYNVSIENMKSISIDWVSGDITVTPYDGAEIELVEYAQRSLKDDEIMVYNTDGGKLSVKFCKNNNFMKIMPPKKLEVFIPAEFAGNMDNFTIDNVSSSVNVSKLVSKYFMIDSVSGDCKAVGIKTDELKIDSTSGTISLTDINSPKVTLDSISGEITASNLTSEDISSDTTSGDMNFQDVTTGKLSFDTTSGEITYNGSYESLKVDTSSGDMRITDKISPKSFKIDSVSGEVNLTMPAFDNFVLNKDTVSGDFNCNIPVKLNGKGSNTFRIDTTSGDITIDEYK